MFESDKVPKMIFQLNKGTAPDGTELLTPAEFQVCVPNLVHLLCVFCCGLVVSSTDFVSLTLGKQPFFARNITNLAVCNLYLAYIFLGLRYCVVRPILDYHYVVSES